MNTEVKKRGRPNTGCALTPAEKQAAYRSRQKSIINQALVDQELIKENKKLMELAYPNGVFNDWLTWKKIAELEVQTSQSLRKDIENMDKEMSKLRAENNKLRSKK